MLGSSCLDRAALQSGGKAQFFLTMAAPISVTFSNLPIRPKFKVFRASHFSFDEMSIRIIIGLKTIQMQR